MFVLCYTDCMNHFIKEENISTERYLSCFFPFDKIDFRKKGIESSWSTDSPEMMALIMTMKNKPQAVMMSFQREYAEFYDWLVEVFRDWAFTFFSSFFSVICPCYRLWEY